MSKQQTTVALREAGYRKRGDDTTNTRTSRVSFALLCVQLTVGAAKHLQPQAHPAAGVPVEGDEAQEARSHRVGEPVLDHGLRIDVTEESLQEHSGDKDEALVKEIEKINEKKQKKMQGNGLMWRLSCINFAPGR